DLGERLDRRQIALHLRAADPHDLAVNEDVLPPAEFGIESRAQFAERRDPAARPPAPLCRLQNPAHNLEQRTLPAAVRPHETDYLALLHAKAHIAQSPEIRVQTVRMQRIQLADPVPRRPVKRIYLGYILNEQQISV